MKLIRQVFGDLKKEIGWVIFYGILATLVIISFISMSQSFGRTVSQNKVLNILERNDIYFVSLDETNYKTDPIKSSVNYDISKVERVDDYFAAEFAPGGKAGSMVILSGECGFNRVIMFLGVYADLMPCPVERTDPVTFVVSYDKKDAIGETVKIGWREFPVYVADKDMVLIHPSYHEWTMESGELADTLFVYSRDYEAFKEIFPSRQYWSLRTTEYFRNFILMSPGREDVLRVRNVISKDCGGYLYISPVNEYLRMSKSGEKLRTARINMIFYITASVALTGAMVMNIYRAMKRKIKDYATHHLFGASESFIFARMFLFTLFYHIIPIFGTTYTIGRLLKYSVLKSTNSIISVSVLLIIVILLGVTCTAFINFKNQFSRGSGRE